MMRMKRAARELCMHCIPITVAICFILSTSFLTVLTKQSMVPLNKGSSPGFGSGVV